MTSTYEEVNTSPNSYRIKHFEGYQGMGTDPDYETSYIYPVTVKDPQGKVKRIISVREITSREMEKGRFLHE